MMVQYHDGNISKKIHFYIFYFILFLYRTYTETKFNPSSSLLHGLHQPTTINTVPSHSETASAVKFSEYDTNSHLPPRSTSTRPTIANSILKSSIARWPPSYEDDNHDDQYDLRASSSASFVDDVRRMVS
jgi:hypothetical protein